MLSSARRVHPNLTFADAVEIFLRWSRSHGYIEQQPSESLSELVRGTWYLRNVRGHVARVGVRSASVIA